MFIQTNPFRTESPQYARTSTAILPYPSSDTRMLVAVANKQLRDIYRRGYAYKRAGIQLLDLGPVGLGQPDLFASEPAEHGDNGLMSVVDRINQRMGKGALRYASAVARPRWQARTDRQSPAYTTRWSDLVQVRAGANRPGS